MKIILELKVLDRPRLPAWLILERLKDLAMSADCEVERAQVLEDDTDT